MSSSNNSTEASSSDDDNATITAFGYIPMDSLAYSAMSLYLVLGLLSYWTYRLIRPPRKFMLITVGSAAYEALGYGLRVVAAHYTNVISTVFPTSFILLVPNALALVNYIVVGRALMFSGLNVGYLRPQWLALTFFFADIMSFVVQGLGGLMVVVPVDIVIDIGMKVILVGLGVQCVSLSIFVYVCSVIQRRPQYLIRGRPGAARMLLGLYVTTALLFVRSIYRVTEFASGKDTYITTHEWPAYAFDCLVISLCFLFYIVPSLHYGRCLNELQAALDAEGVIPAARGNQVRPEPRGNDDDKGPDGQPGSLGQDAEEGERGLRKQPGGGQRDAGPRSLLARFGLGWVFGDEDGAPHEGSPPSRPDDDDGAQREGSAPFRCDDDDGGLHVHVTVAGGAQVRDGSGACGKELDEWRPMPSAPLPGRGEEKDGWLPKPSSSNAGGGEDGAGKPNRFQPKPLASSASEFGGSEVRLGHATVAAASSQGGPATDGGGGEIGQLPAEAVAIAVAS